MQYSDFDKGIEEEKKKKEEEKEKEKLSDSMPRHFPEEMAEAKIGSNVGFQNTLILNKIHWFLMIFCESSLRR